MYEEKAICDKCKRDSGRIQGSVTYLDHCRGEREFCFCEFCSFEIQGLVEKARSDALYSYIQPERLNPETPESK